ncbi:MAG: hypothetical protein GC160_27490 [Acidobacteria bacterium]|nr:hypothetical protein [Acidobacteriota bacterium]
MNGTGERRTDLQSPAGLLLLWLAGTAGLIWLWSLYRSPEAVQAAPGWWLGVSAWLGSVPYQGDPALELRIRVSRLLFLWTVVCLALWIYERRRQVADILQAFARMEVYPLSLAIFRIAVFYQISNILWTELIVPVAALPEGLQYPLATGVPDIGWLGALAYWPAYRIPPEWVRWMMDALGVVCWFGLAGLFSRLSAALAAVLLVLGWGSIQWYGKVDHHHHLVWFALLLATSRCGDALSIDSLLQAWRRAGKGITAPPPPGRAYGAPIALAMVLLGVAYFFPGFWKFWRSGLDWAFSDSPLYTLYGKWRMMGGEPMSAIDRQPWLLQWGSLGVMLLEMAFLPLMFNRRTRMLAAAGGLSFHLGGQLTGRYGFESLMGCYVIFIEWGRLFRWFGGKLYGEPLVCRWTPASRWEATALGAVRTLDVFGAVAWQDGRPLPTPGLEVDRAGGLAQGSEAFLLVARRLPLLWPLIPLAWLGVGFPSGAASGRWAPAAALPLPAPLPRAAVLTAALLLTGNLYLGARRDMNGWPVACYPLFDGISTSVYRSLRLVVWDADGEREVVPDAYRETFGNRWNILLLRTLEISDPEARRTRFTLLWNKMIELDPKLAQATRVRFLSIESSLEKGRWDEPPANPQVLFESDLPLVARR